MDEQVSVTPPEGPQLSREAKQWAMLTHLAAFAAFFIPFGNMLGPLVAWQLKKDFDPLCRRQWQRGGELSDHYRDCCVRRYHADLVGIGVFLLPLLGVYWIAMTIIAGG